MKTYIGTKVIKARPMTRGEYNEYRSWQMPANEDPNENGYLVEYTDNKGHANDTRHEGYISYCPADVFDISYIEIGQLNFGQAIAALKLGKKVTREGWNGKGMFLYLVPANSYPAQTGAAKEYWGEKAMVPYRAYIAMKTAQEDVVCWTASQSDVLAEDWTIIEE